MVERRIEPIHKVSFEWFVFDMILFSKAKVYNNIAQKMHEDEDEKKRNTYPFSGSGSTPRRTTNSKSCSLVNNPSISRLKK